MYIEDGLHMSYGKHVYLGDYFYANFNLTIIDDGEVHIGDLTMIGPNVTICTTGHPVDPHYREMAAHYSLPIYIGKNVWIGSNAAILPGVSIGDNTVIGAGSVVTRDIPVSYTHLTISFSPIFPQHFKGPSSSHLITGLYLKSDIAGRSSSVFPLKKISP